MKLAPLLAQYLYDQKKLDLSGIGTFVFDPSARTGTDAQHASQGISFQNNASIKNDENLVNYISSKTGKMNSLASSDLNSYLELARQFLNIGKPFQLEGIGTLVKHRNGHLEFTTDHMLGDKIKEGIKELSATSISDNSLTTYENLRAHEETSPSYKKILVGLLIVVTTGIIIWAGYKVYKNNSSKSSVPQENEQGTVTVNDSIQSAQPAAGITKTIQHPGENPPAGKYRFVIEVANRKRAFYRYEMLQKARLPIQMSTTDSITYKLFFVLPATPADTARISDSLSIFYPALNRKKTFAEK